MPCLALPCPAPPRPAPPRPALPHPRPRPARPTLPCPALPCPVLPCPALPCPALPCPALPCPALPCPALPCPALQLIWQAVWTFLIPYILASVIKDLLDRFGRVQMSAARLVTGARKYDLEPLVLHVLSVSGVFKGGYWAMPLSAKKISF